MQVAANRLGTERMRLAAEELKVRIAREKADTVQRNRVQAVQLIAKLRQQDIDRKARENKRDGPLFCNPKRFVRSLSNR